MSFTPGSTPQANKPRRTFVGLKGSVREELQEKVRLGVGRVVLQLWNVSLMLGQRSGASSWLTSLMLDSSSSSPKTYTPG